MKYYVILLIDVISNFYIKGKKMRYYEIVFMVHPDFSDQISNIVRHYTEIVTSNSGKIFRTENWGCRQLAYPIRKIRRAYYILLNIEVSKDTINMLSDSFRFNNAIIRSLIMRIKDVVTEPSFMIKNKEEHQDCQSLNVIH